MKIQVLNIETNNRIELIDITAMVSKIVKNSKVEEGICVVYTPHTTAGITINENADPDVKRDIIKFLGQLIPQDFGFSHAEGNSDSHLKSSFLGCEKNIIVHNGNLMLGTWQSIYFCEFDGPRNRKVYVKMIKG